MVKPISHITLNFYVYVTGISDYTKVNDPFFQQAERLPNLHTDRQKNINAGGN